MGITDIIVIAVLLAVVCAATAYIVKAKKSGKKCIGCPDGCSCSAKKGGGSCCCGCSETADENEKSSEK